MDNSHETLPQRWRLSCVQYFRLSVLLPFFAPVLFLLLLLPTIFFPRLPQWYGFIAIAPLSGIVLFGLPYALLVVIALMVLRRRSWRAYAITAAFAPCLMVLMIALCFLLLQDRYTWSIVQQFALSCLVVGYFYVAVTFIGFYLLRRRGHLVCEGSV